MRIKFLDTGEVVDLRNHLSGGMHNIPVKDMYEKALVSFMKLDTQFFKQSNEEFMKDYARRAVISSNQDIRATSEKHFFDDLIENEHIEII